MASPVIDVHTHCLTEAWFQLLQQHGGPRYTVKAVTGGLRAIHLDGAPFMTPVPPMFDYGPAPEDDGRVRRRRLRRVAHVPELLLGRARREPAGGEDHERRHGRRADRASGPPALVRVAAVAVRRNSRCAELERAHQAGAAGVMVLANIGGVPLTDPAFAPIWAAIDAKALPVLVHPTAPPGVADMDMARFQLTASIGFTFDTSLAIGAHDLRRLLRPLSAPQDHRGARRRRAAVPRVADGPVLRQHPGVPREDRTAADAPTCRRSTPTPSCSRPRSSTCA